MSVEAKIRSAVERGRPGEALLILACEIDELKRAPVTEDWSIPAPSSDRVVFDEPEPSDPEERLVWEAKRRAAADAGRTTPDVGVARSETATISVGVDKHEVVVPVAPAELQDSRAELAASMFGDGNWWSRPELAIDSGQARLCYVKGGPIWLHAYDRDFVMGLPKATRVAMVQDLETHAPEDAHSLAADILKDEKPDGTRAIQLEGQGHHDL